MYKTCYRFLQPSLVQRSSFRFNCMNRRTFFGMQQDDKRYLKRLEKEANKFPTNPLTQLQFIRELNKNYPEKAIQRIEDQRFASSSDIIKEYLKALVATKKINHADMPTVLKQLQSQLSQSESQTAPTLHPYPTTYNMFPPGTQTMTSTSYPSTSAFPSASFQKLDFGHMKERPIYVSLVNENQLKALARRLLTTAVALGALYLASLFLIDTKTMGISSGKPKQIDSSKSDKTFDDVKGVDEAKQELEEIVQYLRDPHKFTRLGGRLPKGVLLVGPPGTGKTLLARAIAGEANVSFYYASGSDFEEMYVGVGARRVRDLFESAKNQHAPCIIFIDEIDAIGGKRRLKEQQALKMTLNQLLVEMDGFGQNTGIIVIGATNVPESLDSALVRPGRFDRHVVVPLPDVGGRKQILEFYTRNIPISKDVDLNVLARGTPGMSGAELMNVVNEAALHAAMLGVDQVTMEILDHAKDKILMGRERRSAVISPESTKLTAFHEAGHALVALNTPGAMPVYKATVMPRGQALGMVSQLPEGDQTSVSKKELLAKIDVCMGGRAAEEIVYGPDDITAGASNDFMQATNVARNMITLYGMNDKIGPIHHDMKPEHISPETKRIIDDEIRKILDASYARAKNILIQNRESLNKVANALIQYETLSGEEINDLLKGKKLTRDLKVPVTTPATRKSKSPGIAHRPVRSTPSKSRKDNEVEETK